jgi:hypothetical protein
VVSQPQPLPWALIPHGTYVRKRSGSRGHFQARHLPPSGFLATLSTVYSLSRLAGPVSDRQHLRVLPSERSLRRGRNSPSGELMPRLPLPQAFLRRAFWTQRSSGLSIDSRVLPRANPLQPPQVFNPVRRWMLPWFFSPLRDRHRTALIARLRTMLLSRTWSPAWLPTRSIPVPQSVAGNSTHPARKG